MPIQVYDAGRDMVVWKSLGVVYKVEARNMCARFIPGIEVLLIDCGEQYN
jgi:hypothetical protein